MLLEDKDWELKANHIMGIKIKSSGDFKNTETFLLSHKKGYFTDEQMIEIAEKSVELFKKNTPTKSGETANSWSYDIDKSKKNSVINIHNSNIQNGINIAILVDEGHALQTGQYVAGKHYIDQTIKEIFNYINKMK